MHIYFEVDFQEQAQHYQAVLYSRGDCRFTAY